VTTFDDTGNSNNATEKSITTQTHDVMDDSDVDA